MSVSIKDDIYINEIMALLATDYNNNLHYYDKAKEEVYQKYNLISRLNSFNTNNNYINYDDYRKTTHIDIKNKTLSLEYSNAPDALLAYNYEFMTVRRIFPYSLNTFVELNKTKDLGKAKTEDEKNEALRVIQWVKDRILTTNFSLGNISVDKENGVFKYNTNQRDANYGPTLQYITCKLPTDRSINIPMTNQNGPIKNIAKNYDTLFSYFMAFGFTEFYARCTCFDYVRKYAKRDGISNYFCPHILYAMAQLPYYLIYTLK